MADEATTETVDEVQTTETVDTTTVAADKADAKMYPESYVKKIHTENASRRKREEELALKLKEYQDKELAAETDLKKKVEQYEKRVTEMDREHAEKIAARDRRIILSEAKRLAKDAGMIDVDDVASLNLDDLRLDDEGNVSGIEDIIASTKERKPHWFKAEKTADEKLAEKKPVVTPARKNGESSLDYATVPDAEFSKKLATMGVKI